MTSLEFAVVEINQLNARLDSPNVALALWPIGRYRAELIIAFGLWA